MYNTQFKVKYNEIKQELCSKLKTKTEKEYEENSDDPEVSEYEYEYSSEDVIDICNKLYIDEFISVFDAEDLFDDKIVLGIKYVFEQMCINTEFSKIIEDISQIALKTFPLTDELTEQKLLDFKQLIILTLFSKNIFYITHMCICQQLETGIIDDDLLVQLKAGSIDLLTKQCPDI